MTSTGFTRRTPTYKLETTLPPYNGPSGSSSGGYFVANSDAAGGKGSFDYTTITTLVSPSFSTENYAAGAVSFRQYFQYSSAVYDYLAAVQYSVNGGTWNTITSYSTTQGSDTGVQPLTTLTLPGGALGQANVRIRFAYTADWSYYWAIDDVSITGTPQPITYAVSPTTDATVSGNQITFSPRPRRPTTSRTSWAAAAPARRLR